MARLRLLLFLVFLLRPGTAAGADVIVHGESERTSRRFEEIVTREEGVRKEPSEERWGEVIAEYQALLASSGDDLVTVKGRDGLLVQVRWLCHARLAALPPVALRLYRGRVDGRAAKWLEQGQRDRDVRLLRRVVEDTFCSRASRTALDLLGDLAFERGDFAEAEFWWRLLSPRSGERTSSFLPRYPDAKEDEAAAQAKQLLARWFAGGSRRRASWRRELEAFRKQHPQAEGHLAGARGLYWKRLEAVGQADLRRRGLAQPRAAGQGRSARGAEPAVPSRPPLAVPACRRPARSGTLHTACRCRPNAGLSAGHRRP